MKKYMLVLVLILVLVPLAIAQDTELPLFDDEFALSDGSLRLSVPTDWLVRENTIGSIIVMVDDAATMNIFPPAVLAQIVDMDDSTTMDDIVAGIEATQLADETMDFDHASKARVGDYEVRVIPVQITIDDLTPEVGLYYIIDTGEGGFLWMQAFSNPENEGITAEELGGYALALIETIELGTWGLDGEVTGDLPLLRDITGFHQGDDPTEESIAGLLDELVAMNLIGTTDGDMLMSEFMTMFAPSASDPNPYNDYVMGALISFRPPEGANAFCGYVVRETGPMRGGEGDYIFIGIYKNEGELGAAEILVLQYDETYDDAQIYAVASPTDFFSPTNLIAVIDNNELTVFVNEEVVIERLNVAPISNVDTEFYEQTTEYAAAGQNCVISPVFIYGLDDE